MVPAPRYGSLGGTANRPPITIIGMSIGSSSPLRRSPGYPANTPPMGIPASFRTFTNGSPLVGSPSGLMNARLSQTKLAELCACAPRVVNPTSMPAFCNACASTVANHAGSTSTSDATMTDFILPLSFCIVSNCSLLSVRAANCLSSATRARSASAACANAFPARSVASPSLFSDRLVSSSESSRSRRPKNISPTTPSVTITSAATGPQWLKTVSGGSWKAAANNTSNSKPKTTAAAPQSAAFSLREMASLRFWSVLLIYPYRGSAKGPHLWIAIIAALAVCGALLLARHFGFVR